MVFASSSRKHKSEKIRKRNKSTRRKHYYQKHRQVISLVLYLVGLIVFFLVLIALWRATFFAPKYTIEEVAYDPQSIAIYDNPVLYQGVTQVLLGKNYFMTKWFGKNELHQEAQEQFPLVRSIRFNQQTGSVIFARIEFNQPTFVFLIPPDRKVAVYADTLYPLASGNTLGNDSPVINLPRYTSWFNNLHGILFKIPETTLLRWIQTIENTLGKEHIHDMTYLPGGEKLFVIYKGKLIYFHLAKDINLQLAKLVDLESYYGEFSSLQEIDLGSIDDSIVK